MFKFLGDPENLFGYYGVDWTALILTFVSIYMLGRKSKWGFVFGIGASLCWLTFGIMVESVANVAANVIFIALHIRGWWKWTREPVEAKNAAPEEG
ncbi:MAG: nicotinamide mononucleotide transporter [Phycisphaerae bacterium]